MRFAKGPWEGKGPDLEGSWEFTPRNSKEQEEPEESNIFQVLFVFKSCIDGFCHISQTFIVYFGHAAAIIYWVSFWISYMVANKEEGRWLMACWGCVCSYIGEFDLFAFGFFYSPHEFFLFDQGIFRLRCNPGMCTQSGAGDRA